MLLCLFTRWLAFRPWTEAGGSRGFMDRIEHTVAVRPADPPHNLREETNRTADLRGCVVGTQLIQNIRAYTVPAEPMGAEELDKPGTDGSTLVAS